MKKEPHIDPATGTVKVKSATGYCNINAADYNPDVHEEYVEEKPKAEEPKKK